MDIITQAVRLALNSKANYNPGLPLCVDFRPLTLDSKYGSPDPFTPKGTNIYKGQTHRTRSALLCSDINSRIRLRVLSGDRGCSSDFTGLLILCFYAQDPDAWYGLFNRPDLYLPYAQILTRITGLPLRAASAFVNGTESLFKGETNPDHPLVLERVLRAHQEF